jgi:hypothetical protein
MKPGDEVSLRAPDSPMARRILAIDQEIAMLERVRPKMRFSVHTLVPLLLLPAVIAYFVSSGRDIQWLHMIKWTSILLGVPAVLYGSLLLTNWRQRHRLEREMDELVGDPDGR